MENVAVQSGIASSVEFTRPFIPCYAATRGTFVIIVAHIDQFRLVTYSPSPFVFNPPQDKTNHDSDESQICHIW
jgi:hypothetical protein